MYKPSTQASVAAQVALQGMSTMAKTVKTSGSSPTNPGAVLYAVPAPG